MPTDEDKKKYDRQLRIWGAHGQKKLENARVCLLNAGPTGSETLKNLVLGGIAAFTIVDDAQVQASDLGNNFLLDANSLGKSRAECVTQLLKELNPSVSGSFVEDSAANLLESRAEFFKEFELIIAAQVEERLAIKLDEVCRANTSKLIVARSYGLAGYLRPSLAEHQIIESKPDYPEEDLRLHQPWPALEDWATGIDLDSLDDAAHAHVPYAALLVKAVKSWQEDNGQTLPSNSKEKAAFKDLIKSWQRKIDGFPVEEENYTEALESRRLYKIFSPPTLPSEVREILDDSSASISGADVDDFWILVAALKRFVENEGAGNLPLEGSIPDMTATTAMYLELQRIFRERANSDVAALETHVRHIEAAAGRSSARLPSSAIRFFAKHARNIRLVRYKSLEEEAKGKGSAVVRAALEKEDMRINAALYLLLRAADRFHATYNRFPGSFDNGVEEDVALLKAVAAAVASEASLSGSAIPDDYVGEIVRFGACELHVVAAVMGGIAAQEAIKLLTEQFVPLKGTLIYNAMAGTSAVFD